MMRHLGRRRRHAMLQTLSTKLSNITQRADANRSRCWNGDRRGSTTVDPVLHDHGCRTMRSHPSRAGRLGRCAEEGLYPGVQRYVDHARRRVRSHSWLPAAEEAGPSEGRRTTRIIIQTTKRRNDHETRMNFYQAAPTPSKRSVHGSPESGVRPREIADELVKTRASQINGCAFAATCTRRRASRARPNKRAVSAERMARVKSSIRSANVPRWRDAKRGDADRGKPAADDLYEAVRAHSRKPRPST